MHTQYNGGQPFRPTDYLGLEHHLEDDNKFHRHYRADQENRARAAAREARFQAFKARFEAKERILALQKPIEEDVSGTRISPLYLHAAYLTRAVRASPLFRMPANVREMVFTQALLASPQPVPVRKHSMMVTDWEDAKKMQKFTYRWFPALLKVSRQVEKEAAPIFYRVSAFEAKVHGVDCSEITDWIAETDQKLLQEVKKLTIVIEPIGFGDLQAIVEAKRGEGLQAKAERLGKVIRDSIPNAKVKVEGPRELMTLLVDAMSMGIGQDVADGVWKEWKAEIERAI